MSDHANPQAYGPLGSTQDLAAPHRTLHRPAPSAKETSCSCLPGTGRDNWPGSASTGMLQPANLWVCTRVIIAVACIWGYERFAAKMKKDETATFGQRMVTQMYVEVGRAAHKPFIDFPSTCALALESFKILGLEETIFSAEPTAFPSVGEAVVEEAMGLNSTAYSNMLSTELLPNAEMQLQPPPYEIIPFFYIQYLAHGILAHLLGAMAVEEKLGESTEDLFRRIFKTGSVGAMHGSIWQYVVPLEDPVQAWTDLLYANGPCWTGGPHNALDCSHGLGHGFVLWAAVHKPSSSFGTPPVFTSCTVPHVMFATVSINMDDLKYSLYLCKAGPYATKSWEGMCAGGVFHSYIRYSKELAEELVGVQDKLEYVNRTVCSLFDWEVSRVCFGQAMNRVRGKYVLASPSAVGLK